jgi:hypothetical protein
MTAASVSEKKPGRLRKQRTDTKTDPGKAGKHLTSGCSFGYGGGEVYVSSVAAMTTVARANNVCASNLNMRFSSGMCVRSNGRVLRM